MNITHLPLIVQMPQEIIESEIFCRLVPLKRLLIKGCAVRITQDLDNDIRMSIYHYEYVPKFADERWVKVWGRTVSPRIINTLADVQQQIYKLWESIPDEFKRKGCDE